MDAIVITAADEGRVTRLLVRMAVPTVASGLLKSSFALVDTHTAGMLSTESQAGLTTAVFFAWMFHSLSSMVSVGALAHVAQASGAADAARARATARRGLVMAATLGVVFSAVFLVVAPRLVTRSGLGDGAHEAARYLSVLALFGPAYWILDALEQTLRGAGFPRVPVVVTAVAAGANAILNPLFAVTLGLGLAGLALATGLAWTFGATALLVVAQRRGLLARGPATNEAPSWARFLVVGAPVAWSGVAFDLVWTLLAPVAATTGAVTLAAIGIGHRLESTGYLAAVGVGHACAALVGQAMGQGRPALARRVAHRAVLIGLALTSAWAVVQLALAAPLFAWFSDDAAVVEAGRDYVALSAVSTVFQGVETILLGAFEGMGKTALPFFLSFLCYASRVPIARWLVGWGAVGIFATTSVTAIAAGIAVAIAFVLRGPGRAGRTIAVVVERPLAPVDVASTGDDDRAVTRSGAA